LAKLLQCDFHEFLGLLPIPTIAAMCNRATTGGLDLRHYVVRVCRRVITGTMTPKRGVIDDDGASLCRQTHRVGCTQSPRGAGDDRNAALEQSTHHQAEGR